MTTTDQIIGLNGFIGYKPPVLCATTANITLSGEQTIDGISATAGDRVLVKDQTDATENGIWVVATGSWARAADFNGSYDITEGSQVFVARGSAQARTQWSVSTQSPVIGSTSIAFAQITSVTSPPTPELFGAAGDGTGDDSAALQAWLDYIVANDQYGEAHGDYRFASTLTISDPHGVFIDATGSTWRLSTDTLGIDVNGRADPTYTDNESRQNFMWVGGHFGCEVTTPTTATMFRMLGMRYATLWPESFGLISPGGFYRDMIIADKDSIYVGRYKTFDCEGTSIEIPPWSFEGGNLLIDIHHVHASIGTNGAQLLKSYQPLNDSVIRHCSGSMGTGATQTAIEIHRYLMVGVSSVTGGPFQAGETVTGGTSGATATFVETYTHDWAFGAGGNTTWLVMGTRSGTFQTGETLTGGTSGATATVPADSAYLVQNSAWNNFFVGHGMHFEAGSGAGAECTAMLLSNNENAGQATLNIQLNLGAVGTNGGGVSYGLKLVAMSDVSITGRFPHTGTNVPIQFDANCTGMIIRKPSFFTTGDIDLNGMSRSELDMADWSKPITATAIGIGGSHTALGTTATAITDGILEPVAGIYPRSLSMTAYLTGSTSSSATSLRLRMFKTGVTAQASKQSLDITGFADSAFYWANFDVELGEDGQFEYDAANTGGGTATRQVYANHLWF